jgi:hypothetical protein
MKWGPRKSGWSQPTGTGGKKRSFARSTSAKHFGSPIPLVANRAAVTSSEAYPLNILDTAHDEFTFVLDSDGMIPAIRTANEQPLVHPQFSLLGREPKGILGCVAAGERLFQENNRMGNQRSDLTWPSI